MRSKHVLLMHISNISGHRSASLAIEQAIKTQSSESQTLSLNAFNYVHPIGERIVNFLYMLVIKKLPFVWDYLYDNPHWVKRTQRIKKAIHYVNLSKLETLFNKFRPDVIISTQAFPCGIVADFKRNKGTNIPLIAVLTDFAPHSYWIYDTIDYYVVPSEQIKQRLLEKGVHSNRVKALGIPFDLKFNKQVNKAEIRKKLDLKEDLFTILIMGGGQGLGPIKNIVDALDDLEIDIQEIVVCGMNKYAYNWLKKRHRCYKKKVSLFGYVQNIEELMSAADIIITKPGGVTCAEALNKGLPILIISPLPGQETANTSYLIRHGAAIQAERLCNLVDLIKELYNNRWRLTALSNNAIRISKPNAARDIAKLILEL